MQQAPDAEITTPGHDAGRGGVNVSPNSSQQRLITASLQSLAQEMNEIADQASSLLKAPPGGLSADSAAFSRIARRTVPRWHFAMLNDAERNDALAAALERSIPTGATVLDIGSGSGLLAMAAARAGAARVITCEMNPLLAEVARQVVDAHGLADVITVIGRPSTALEVGRDLDGPVDVLVSEIVDCGLIGEGLLPSVRHAREHLLAPHGIMLPSAARLYGRLVSSEAVLKLNQVTTADGFDVSLMNTLATRGHFPVRLDTWPHRFLSEAARVLDFDLARDDLEPGERPVSLLATADGEAHALLVWFELDMGGGITLRNSPENTRSHWMQGWVPLEKPVPTKAGETVSFRLRWSDYMLSAHC
ncbi:50S ribosomal protein L11 methyltransferase [Streptomyces sp. TRM49041]|uniref:50S ribosomal protein L11 methyltransferase n=1 Tax=Streptomyces sp. TRM49041 TaxID=2603216 RepID=UPI0011EDE4BE|nr:50S ribosomal protein L11 methyltransferase [Streptomyces sp. TRM49041]